MKDLNKIYSILKDGTTYPPVSTEYINNIEKSLILFFLMSLKFFIQRYLMVLILIDRDYII